MSESRERREFCPECGETVPPRSEPLPGEPRDRDRLLCDDCYFETFDLVDAPERVAVRVCSQCGAVHRGNQWVDVGARDYTDVAVEAVTQALGVHLDAREVSWGVEPEQVDETTIRMHCRFDGIVRETAVAAETTVPVKIARETCKRCGRIAGGSYAATVQVRAAGRTPTTEERATAVEIAQEVVREREDAGDREAFLTEVDRTDDGPNVKLSTTKLGGRVADRIVQQLGGSVSDSATLVTEDGDGNEVYRVTYSVRLPRFREGDVIDPEPADLDAVEGSGPVLVRSAGDAVSGVRLDSGEAFSTDADLSEARQLTHVDDADTVTVVTVEDDHAVQVLDPETFAARTVPNPSFLTAEELTEGAELPAVKVDGEVLLLPERETE